MQKLRGRGESPMQWSQQIFSASRPLVFILILSYYMSITAARNLFALGVYAVAAAFFLASSAVLVAWIPAPARLRARLMWAEWAVVTFLVWFANRHGDGSPMQILYIVVAITVPIVLARRWWWVSLGAVLLSFGFTSVPVWRANDWVGATMAVGVNGLAIFVASTVGMLIHSLYEERDRRDALLRELGESKAALERAHRQLQESAAHQQAVAVLEERQRLAREIHDSVAHGLTVLVIQIQAGRRLLERAPDEAAATFQRCEDLAREALTETRRAVRALHNTGAQGGDADALERLAREYSMATGIAVEVAADDAARRLPPEPARLEQFYRIFQEALTNAHRHGGAAHVRATLAVAAGQVCLSITNDGAAPSSLTPGVGLLSMAERAQSLGGSVRFEPGAEAGLTIQVLVPLKEDVAG